MFLATRIHRICKICFLLIIPCASFAGFEREKEFPNYFALDGVQEELLEKAVFSLSDRLYVPFYRGNRRETRGILEEVRSKVTAVDPQAKVYLSGRVVSSIFSYIYEKIDKSKRDDLHKKATEILQEMVASTKPIALPKATGIDGKLDIIVVPSHGKENAIKNESNLILSSIRKASSDVQDDAFDLSHPIEISQMTNEELSQIPGSSLNHLHANLLTRKITPPAYHPDALKSLLSGQYSYRHVPHNVSQGLVIDGVKPLVSLPFLQLDPASEAVLSNDLDAVLTQIQNGEGVPSEVVDGFNRIAKDSLRAGSKGRLQRSNGKIETKVMEISDQAGTRSERDHTLVPHFLDSIDPKTRAIKSNKIDSHLMPLERFNQEKTDDGYFYHGTRLEYLPAILKRGLVPGSDASGFAAYGRGVYSAGKGFFDIALSYSNKSDKGGTVFQFKLDPESHPRILNWPEVQGEPAFHDIQIEAKAAHQGLFEYLAENYGIDIIINGNDILIQNSAAINMPKNFKELTKSQSQSLIRKLSPSLKYEDRSNFGSRNLKDPTEAMGIEFLNYARLYRLASSHGAIQIPHPKTVFALAVENFDPKVIEKAKEESKKKSTPFEAELFEVCLEPQNSPILRRFAATALMLLDENSIKKFSNTVFKDSDLIVSRNAALGLSQLTKLQSFPEILKRVIKDSNKDFDMRTSVFNALSFYDGDKLDEVKALFQAEMESSYGCPREISDALTKIPLPGQEELRGDWIKEFLGSAHDPNRECAALALAGYKGQRWRELYNIARQDQSASVKTAAAYALSKNSLPGCEQLQLQALADQDEVLRSSAAAGINNCPGKTKTQRLEMALSDKSERVRLQAAETLIYFSGSEKLKLISKALKDDSQRVGQTASFSIMRGVKDQDKVIKGFALDPDPRVSGSMAYIIAHSYKGSDRTQLLENLFKNPASARRAREFLLSYDPELGEQLGVDFGKLVQIALESLDAEERRELVHKLCERTYNSLIKATLAKVHPEGCSSQADDELIKSIIQKFLSKPVNVSDDSRKSCQ